MQTVEFAGHSAEYGRFGPGRKPEMLALDLARPHNYLNTDVCNA